MVTCTICYYSTWMSIPGPLTGNPPSGMTLSVIVYNRRIGRNDLDNGQSMSVRDTCYCQFSIP